MLDSQPCDWCRGAMRPRSRGHDVRFADKLQSQGPHKLPRARWRRIRGVITLAILGELQAQLQALKRDDTFVLADYFDYIGGTSTGAIIATCLSSFIGASNAFVSSTRAAPGDVRQGQRSRASSQSSRTRSSPHCCSARLGQTTLGDERLQGRCCCWSCAMRPRDSPWAPFRNNPHAKYNLTDRADCNLRLLLLVQLVRASTAAPTHFPPETIDVGAQRFVFVDGGVTMFTNPAFQLFLMATLP